MNATDVVLGYTPLIRIDVDSKDIADLLRKHGGKNSLTAELLRKHGGKTKKELEAAGN